MAYIQWAVTTSSGSWWYPWTVVCDFSRVLNPLSFSLTFTLAVLLMVEHLVLLAPSFSEADWMIPKHHPASLVGFQGRLVSHPCVVPRAAALPRISLQGGDWMLQLCTSDVASGMHSLCHASHPNALGNAGWHILILCSNKIHVLFRLWNSNTFPVKLLSSTELYHWQAFCSTLCHRTL